MSNINVYREQGGDRLVVASGGEIDILSGGALKSAGSAVALIAAQSAIADLNQDISASYVEAEVQAISDKVDAILAALRSAGVIAT